VPPDPGCYEERYRLTRHAALRLAGGLVSLGLGLGWPPAGSSAAMLILALPLTLSALGVAATLPGVFAAARRMTAFRADYTGITFGGVPHSLAALRRPALVIPWAEVDKIVLYLARADGRGGTAPVRGIAVQRGTPAPAMTPGAPRAMARTVAGWKLDRARLTAVTAAVAPGIPVVDDSPAVSRRGAWS
jgi:hypothetical protein